jgi:hypothetical protein
MSDTARNNLVFFRHLPKTAGTSLTTTLANIYGDGQCHRFRDVGQGFQDIFSSVLQARGGILSLVSGHIPLHTVPEGKCGTEFTILREPIARLLSLRRFLEQQPAADRARMGLGDNVTIADMLASRNSEVYGQVRNGMARFFSSHRGFADPSTDEFWDPLPVDDVLDDCAAVLERQTVGTVEDMPGALRMLQRRLRVPYELDIGMENFTVERVGEVPLADIRALIEANSIDLALFHAVMKRLPKGLSPASYALGDGFDRRTLFDPQPGQQYNPMQVPGRQGFELFEPAGKLCWLGDSGRGRIHLAPSAVPLSLTLAIYGIVPHYPLREMAFQLDGARWPASQFQAPSNIQFTLGTIPPHSGPMELTVVQPYAVPVAAITLGSPDRRRLGSALLNIRCDAA